VAEESREKPPDGYTSINLPPGFPTGPSCDKTKPMVGNHWSYDKSVGKKMACRKTFSSPPHVIPVYDHYKLTFNRELHDHSWPHKRGGRETLGDFGRQHDLLLACILQNTFNCSVELKHINSAEANFRDSCLVRFPIISRTIE
jgi:hypothetical protein